MSPTNVDQTLLAALVAFIAPVVRACAPSDTEDQIVPDPAVSQRLLDSLKEFITASTKPKQRKTKTEKYETDTLASPYLQSKISTNLRAYVSTTMPIRLLSFDETGSSIQLLERRDVVGLLQPILFRAASEPAFQARWNEVYLAPWSRGFTSPEQMQSTNAAASTAIDALIASHAQYAILSHTWLQTAPGDVVFQDWAVRGDNALGNAKIVNFCRVAAQAHGVRLAWMDTVCINKESSTELDESIRSMYKWYRTAAVCVAYLGGTRDLRGAAHEDPWFTRGWTLQELLAPQNIKFYNSSWDSADGVDIEASVRAATTLTDAEMGLFRRGETEAVPISRRLQLAAGREVTRAEDSAYSLMGLLGVDISIAYGEGPERAFARLIRALLNTKKDVLDVFNHGYTGSYASVIPPSLAHYTHRLPAFDAPQGQALVSLLDKYRPSPPLLLTHVGLRMRLLLVPGLIFDASVDCVSFTSATTFFRESYAGPDTAQGRFYGHHQLYDLLHRDLYAEVLPDRTESRPASLRLPRVLVFGVLNFGETTNFSEPSEPIHPIAPIHPIEPKKISTTDAQCILLPSTCLAIPLACGDVAPARIRPSSLSVYHPPSFARDPVPAFALKAVAEHDDFVIAHSCLAQHGMQLMTVYL